MADLSFEETNAILADAFHQMDPGDRLYEPLQTVVEYRDERCAIGRTWRWLLYCEARANMIELLRGRGVFLEYDYRTNKD